MKEQYLRSAMLVGEKGIEKLNKAKLIVFGAGGVGSFAIEALARCAPERLDIVDSDIVSLSNINRQLIALHSTVGRRKTEVAKERIADISPETEVTQYDFFYSELTKDKIDLRHYDYIVDAIDSMDSKVLLVKEAKKAGVPIISALSTGNKLDVTKFTVADIFSTSVCPIAKIMRKRLKEEKIDSLRVVYSTELPIKPDDSFVTDTGKRTVGSISYVPSSVGLMLAGEVIKDIISEKK